MNCIKCGSTHTKKSKQRRTKDGLKQQYKCKSCESYFTAIQEEDASVTFGELFDVSAATGSKRYVITSAQNNTQTNLTLLGALKNYCRHNDAKLLIIPTKLKQVGEEFSYCSHVEPYLFYNTIELHPKLRVMGGLSIPTTTVNPLAGLDGLTKGRSLIVGHSQLQMKTLPVQSTDLPVIVTTTGTVSTKRYPKTKQGYRAEFNHSFGALVVELSDDLFHIRNLNFDGDGFYDLEYYYTPVKKTKTGSVDALITGDEHAIFFSPDVLNATYTGKESIVETLRPKYIVRHDLLDSFAVSHHHQGRTLTNFIKHKTGMNRIEAELEATVNHLINTTPIFSENIIVASNHHDHLMQWLNSCDPRAELWNAVIYHTLMLELLKQADSSINKVKSMNPFQIYAQPILEHNRVKTKFLSRSESFKLHGIELACHGDAGTNGARGSKNQFANLPSKMVVGHTHSPSIEKSCYTVGTSSHLELEYTKGPSSWLNTHCIIYPNGKRQLINIIKGQWRA